MTWLSLTPIHFVIYTDAALQPRSSVWLTFFTFASNIGILRSESILIGILILSFPNNGPTFTMCSYF
ncbi:hypothetical protein AB6A40_011082 [Gnathostoma spinigerum]|uniref:Uncharacterized protein n=1 Tax=Gnathostoma spinigerum TaxID=75299 RepID=A0ABD6F2X6_9BILA